MRKVALVLGLALGVSGVGVGQQNQIVGGRGNQAAQQSAVRLLYAAPGGWFADDAAAREAGIMAVLVPKGRTLATADRAITVAFQKKDARDPTTADLQSFFRADMEMTLGSFPDMQAARWQPPGLNPEAMRFMSIELYGKEKDKPSPHRLLMIDGGDGYFSVTATAGTREELGSHELEAFFDSVRIEK